MHNEIVALILHELLDTDMPISLVVSHMNTLVLGH